MGDVLQVFLAGLLIGGAVETLAAIADGSFQAVLEGGNVGPALPPGLRDAVDRAVRSTPEVRAGIQAFGHLPNKVVFLAVLSCALPCVYDDEMTYFCTSTFRCRHSGPPGA